MRHKGGAEDDRRTVLVDLFVDCLGSLDVLVLDDVFLGNGGLVMDRKWKMYQQQGHELVIKRRVNIQQSR